MFLILKLMDSVGGSKRTILEALYMGKSKLLLLKVIIHFNLLDPQKQKVRIEIKGNWDRELAIRDHRSQTNNFVTVWKADPEPENWDDLYRFSIFTLQLNKLTPEMAKLLPPTD